MATFGIGLTTFGNVLNVSLLANGGRRLAVQIAVEGGPVHGQGVAPRHVGQPEVAQVCVIHTALKNPARFLPGTCSK